MGAEEGPTATSDASVGTRPATDSGMAGAARGGHDAYAALRVGNYAKYAAGFVASSVSLQMLNTAVGWEIYERTRDPLHLGYVGLARSLPVVGLALLGGHVADTHDRRRLVVLTQACFAVLAALLALATRAHAGLWIVYGLLVGMGCVRAFNGPARNSLVPLIVPEAVFHNAVAWNATLFQFSATTGPLLAGWAIARTGGAWGVFAASACGLAVFSLMAWLLTSRASPRSGERITFRGLFAGAGFIRGERTIFGAITLDLFAVLLGGATALLPLYAEDILHAGPIGLGALRASSFVGALVMGLVLTHRPPFRRAGPALLWSVAGFGVMTIVFGLSRNLWLSLAALFVAGALDNVSVVIRHVLVQVRTPDGLRGRVSALNAMFIECSNELGGFESGLVARLAGAVFSVVSGGVGTLLVVAGVSAWVPELRGMRRLEPREGSP